MTDVIPDPLDLLSDPRMRERFEQTSAALEAADLVRQMRQQALSAIGVRGISQEELAQRTGLSQPRISQIEKGVGRDGISYALLRRIAYACGIEWGQLLRDAIASVSTASRHADDASLDTTRISEEAPALRDPLEAQAGQVADTLDTLANARPDAFRSHLANALNNLSMRQAELGNREAALRSSQEAVDIYRSLATAYADATQHVSIRPAHKVANGDTVVELLQTQAAANLSLSLATAHSSLFGSPEKDKQPS